MVKKISDDKVQDSVAQKLQTLVVCAANASMRQGALQKRWIIKTVVNSAQDGGQAHVNRWTRRAGTSPRHRHCRQGSRELRTQRPTRHPRYARFQCRGAARTSHNLFGTCETDDLLS